MSIITLRRWKYVVPYVKNTMDLDNPLKRPLSASLSYLPSWRCSFFFSFFFCIFRDETIIGDGNNAVRYQRGKKKNEETKKFRLACREQKNSIFPFRSMVFTVWFDSFSFILGNFESVHFIPFYFSYDRRWKNVTEMLFCSNSVWTAVTVYSKLDIPR